MLRPDVVEAVAAGEFSIYAVGTIDEGIEVLTGVAAGEREDSGGYPEGSVNDRVQKKLRQFTEQLRRMGAASGEKTSPAQSENEN
jgi:hypothetical protein